MDNINDGHPLPLSSLSNQLKLNLGCGDDILPGWVNIDAYNEKADVIGNVDRLAFADNSVDVILASHVLEHFHARDGFDALLEWKRVLKSGGKLIVETPDLLATCRDFVNGDEQYRIALYGQFFAMPWIPGQTHYFLYTENQLYGTLNQCGYKNIVRVKPESTYAKISGLEHIFLRMECVK